MSLVIVHHSKEVIGPVVWNTQPLISVITDGIEELIVYNIDRRVYPILYLFIHVRKDDSKREYKESKNYQCLLILGPLLKNNRLSI